MIVIAAINDTDNSNNIYNHMGTAMKMKMKSVGRRLSLWVVHLHITLLLWGAISQVVTPAALEQPKTYIICMDPSHKPSSFSTHESWHQAILNSLSPSISSASSSSGRSKKLIYSYTHALHGFSAVLTPSELEEIEKSPAHRVTLKERFGKALTTRTPHFLGLDDYKSGVWPATSYGHDAIIGILDSGIWPESESFNDRKYDAVPKRWKGSCENGASSFNRSMCNRKLIRARYYYKGFEASTGRKLGEEYKSPRDFEGHGTHTASTAAGSFVSNVSYFGYARGTAKGIAAGSRLAIYKVMWFNLVVTSDVVAAMDQAMADGVDIISLSVEFENSPYHADPLAIAALKAVNKGINVVCAAGNHGLAKSTHNGAPWITTVGASTIDRNFSAELSLGKLGNNYLKLIKCTSYYPRIGMKISKVPLYYGMNDLSKAQCLWSSLEPAQVQGKVVLCDLMNKNSQSDIYGSIHEVNRTGAEAAIFLLSIAGMSTIFPADYYIPFVVVSSNEDAHTVLNYAMKEETKAVVYELRFGFTNEGTKPAPRVAYFSSRGPDPITPTVLKPDILAPGKDVLAAWVPSVPFTIIAGQQVTTHYAFQSGTSMAAPHIAGVAALLKSAHRDWSPAAIRSAIMTTATTVDNEFMLITDERTHSPATPMDFGAGLVNPNRAINPGLIYDMEVQDYIEFLCTLGYTKEQMEAIIGQRRWNCNSSTSTPDLNYPSFMAVFSTNIGTVGSPLVKNFSRVVTNVGDDKAVYKCNVGLNRGMTIRVQPNTLNFTGRKQKMGFNLTVEVDAKALRSKANAILHGSIHWVDSHSTHKVSSPVVAINV